MAEHLENQVVEPEVGLGVSAEAEAAADVFVETQQESESPPKYDWPEPDELASFVQFSSKKKQALAFYQFKEKWDKWLAEYVPDAIQETPTKYVVNETTAPESALSTANIESEGKPEGISADETDNEHTDPYYSGETNVDNLIRNNSAENDSPNNLKIKWVKGVVIHYSTQKIIDGDETYVFADAEVISEPNMNRVWIKVKGDKQFKEELRKEIIDWFKSYGASLKVACQCEHCQAMGREKAYSIDFETFLYFQRRFIPQIQCYASGELLRLDEISSFSQPEVQVVVLHSEVDSPFFDDFYKFFKKQGDFKIEMWDPKKLLGQPRPEEEILDAVDRAHFVLFMSSVDFDDSSVIQKGAGRAIERFKNGSIFAKVIQLKPFDWQDHPMFKKSAVQTFNAKPIELSDNREEAWREVAKQVHQDIEKWVRVLGKKMEV